MKSALLTIQPIFNFLPQIFNVFKINEHKKNTDLRGITLLQERPAHRYQADANISSTQRVQENYFLERRTFM